ncbi:hypothetical protein [Streptomyces sp. NPDC005251]|uniref:hypothetical protein n=1 Tax=unclassified Streptomyces TaxID=2593676 RepID=UPI0033ADC01D
MGRDAKHKKQARRDQRERREKRMGRPRPEGERFGSVGQAVKDGTISSRTQAARSTVGFLARTYPSDLQQVVPDGHTCGGPLLVHVDGAFQCTAGCPGGPKVVHDFPKALHFCDYTDQLGSTADELGQACSACTASGAADHPHALCLCTGTEIHHRDRTTTCSLGSECPGEDTPHASRQSCGLSEPCDGCGIPAPLLA